MEIFKRRAKHTQSKGKHWRHREAYKPFGTGEEANKCEAWNATIRKLLKRSMSNKQWKVPRY